MSQAIFNNKVGVPVRLEKDGPIIFTIDPNDLAFIEKSTEVYHKVKAYAKESAEKYKDVKVEVDEEGVPTNASEITTIIRSEFEKNFEIIDDLLGEGVSEKVFQGKVSFALMAAFMDFLSETIENNRTSTIKKYSKNRAERRADKKVMD